MTTEVISDDEESEDDTDESEAIMDVLNEFFKGDKTLDEDDVNQILADCIGRLRRRPARHRGARSGEGPTSVRKTATCPWILYPGRLRAKFD